MLIATTNEIPGYEIEEVFGEVLGLTVRSRNMFSQFGAGLKSMVGGELRGMTKALHDSRQQVIDRMVTEAESKGANAIVAMRFDLQTSARPGRRSAPTGRRCASGRCSRVRADDDHRGARLVRDALGNAPE